MLAQEMNNTNATVPRKQVNELKHSIIVRARPLSANEEYRCTPLSAFVPFERIRQGVRTEVVGSVPNKPVVKCRLNAAKY